MSRALALAFALLAAACSGRGASPSCKDACQRDAQCFEESEESDVKFDKGECEEVCSSLERDEAGRKMVAAHLECVTKAPSCEAVRACSSQR